MKKIITTIALALSVMAASAQWTGQYVDDDELKGVIGGMRYLYTDNSMGIFQIAVPYPRQFMLGALHPFQTDYVEGKDQCQVTVGLYTGKTLAEKFTINMTMPRGYQHALKLEADAPEEDLQKADKLISHLYHQGNSVRIIAPLYGSGSFDLTIPSKPNR